MAAPPELQGSIVLLCQETFSALSRKEKEFPPNNRVTHPVLDKLELIRGLNNIRAYAAVSAGVFSERDRKAVRDLIFVK
jgi:hypothetical protein